MMFRLIKGLLATSLLSGLAGCFNLPTAPEQITPTYMSTARYESLECPRLGAEFDSLSRRETQLVVAQEERRRSGKVQAFFLGYGQGDGVEASELANVRGEREAVRKTMEIKKCENLPAETEKPKEEAAGSK